MVKYFSHHYNDINYFRFSVYHFGKNVQSVYAFVIDEVLIDTGQRHNRENVLKALEGREIEKILLTHHHEDHSGNVNYLMNKFNIPAYAHPKAVDILKKGYKMSPLAKVMNGSVEKAVLIPLDEKPILTKNHQLFPIFTPGHCVDHYAYHEPNKGYLFSGDLYVADKIKYFGDYESMKEQIISLEKLVALDFDVLFCSHNPKTKNGKERLTSKLNGFKDFYQTVAHLHSKGLTENEIMKEMGRVENHFYKLVTMGKFCGVQMVKSVVRDLE